MNGIPASQMSEDAQNVNLTIGIKRKKIAKTKTCTKCKVEKLLTQFSKRKNSRFGVWAICKQCLAAYSKVNKKAYYKKNKKMLLSKMKAYRKANKDKIAIQKRDWRKANRDKIKAHTKGYREANKKKIKIRSKIYYRANKEKINAYTKTYIIGRYRTDSKFRLNMNIATAVRRSLKNNKNGVQWEALVGYTTETLKKHLEKQFVNGMTWKNYGEWHIDHIIPISAFNFTKPEHTDFLKCWALKNLQPMWAKENMSKKNKIEKHFQPSLLI